MTYRDILLLRFFIRDTHLHRCERDALSWLLINSPQDVKPSTHLTMCGSFLSCGEERRFKLATSRITKGGIPISGSSQTETFFKATISPPRPLSRALYTVPYAPPPKSLRISKRPRASRCSSCCNSSLASRSLPSIVLLCLRADSFEHIPLLVGRINLQTISLFCSLYE